MRKSRNFTPLMTGPSLRADFVEPEISLQDNFEAFKALGYDYIIHTDSIREISCPPLGLLGRTEKRACPVNADEPLPLNLKHTFRTLRNYKIYGIYDLSLDFEAASEAKYHVPLTLAKTLRAEILNIETEKMRGRSLLERLFTKSDPTPALKDIQLHFE